MLSINLKLAYKFRDRIGQEWSDFILEAMKEEEIRKKISQMIKDKHLYIVDSQNKAIYEKEIQELINQKLSDTQVLQKDPSINDDLHDEEHYKELYKRFHQNDEHKDKTQLKYK